MQHKPVDLDYDWQTLFNQKDDNSTKNVYLKPMPRGSSPPLAPQMLISTPLTPLHPCGKAEKRRTCFLCALRASQIDQMELGGDHIPCGSLQRLLLQGQTEDSVRPTRLLVHQRAACIAARQNTVHLFSVGIITRASWYSLGSLTLHKTATFVC